MDCDGLKKAMIRDLDGTLLGSVGTVIPQSEFEWDGNAQRGLGDYRIPKVMLTRPDGSRIPVDEKAPNKGRWPGRDPPRIGGNCHPSVEFEWDGDSRCSLGDYCIPKVALTLPDGSRISVADKSLNKSMTIKSFKRELKICLGDTQLADRNLIHIGSCRVS